MHLVLTALALVVGVMTVGAQSFRGLGDLPGGATRSRAFDVSGDGSTVVGSSSSTASTRWWDEAIRWRVDEGMVALGVRPAFDVFSNAYSSSSNGDIVVGEVNTNEGTRPFRWTQSSGMVLLPRLAESTVCRALDVSGDGQTVVGDAQVAWNRAEAWMWTAQSGTVSLTPGTNGSARAITPDGRVIVGGGGYWTEATGWVSLGPAPPPFGGGVSPQAVNTDGSVIVGYFNVPGAGDSRAFRWTPQTGVVNLDHLDVGEIAAATAVSGDGRIVVGYSGVRAFIWDAQHGMRGLKDVLTRDYHLDLTGWGLDRATGISADGTVIVGTGAGPNGQEAWMAVIPEPGALGGLIGGVGLLALSLRRRAF